MTLTQQSLIGLTALLVLAATQACGGSDTTDGGVAGAPAVHAGAGGMVGVSGSAPVAGAPSAGAPAGGSSSGGSGAVTSGGSASGGAAAGSGGAAAGSGGATTGSGGRAGAGSGGAGVGGSAAGGSAGGGSGTVTFAQVSGVLATGCAGAMCHGGTNHVNLVMMQGLYTRLTTPLPATAPHCKGTTLVVPSNVAGSFLVKIITGASMCMNNGANENIPRMPDNCSTTSTNPRACLTAAQIKLVSDWVAGGAPQ